jgi:S-adenosylmethionine hydrolase
MHKVKLNNMLSFSVVPHNGKLRFVVHENGNESVCRIEGKKSIQQFLGSEEARIFKGRLQLAKYKNEITVEVKGEPIAILSAKEFEELLNRSS